MKIRSLEVRSHRANLARNVTYVAKSKRRYFLFAPPPPPLPLGQNHFKQSPNPGPEEQNLSRGLPGERGVVTGQIESCITTSEVVVMYLRGQSKKLSLALRYSRMINFIHHDIHFYHAALANIALLEYHTILLNSPLL